MDSDKMVDEDELIPSTIEIQYGEKLNENGKRLYPEFIDDCREKFEDILPDFKFGDNFVETMRPFSFTTNTSCFKNELFNTNNNIDCNKNHEQWKKYIQKKRVDATVDTHRRHQLAKKTALKMEKQINKIMNALDTNSLVCGK